MSRSENDVIGSSSGEEVSSEEEGSGSESELGNKNSSPPATPPTGAKNPNPAVSKKPQPVPDSSSEDSDSESDSDTEPEADPSIKPLASKPMDEEPAKKGRSKTPTVRYSPPVAAKVAAVSGKRAAAATDGAGKETKRAKKAVVVAAAAAAPAAEAEKKQNLFIRIWSEEDEVFLINSMIGYVEKKHKDPIAHVNDFYETVKRSLPAGVNVKQMSTKLRRLRKKFMNNAGREQQKGKVRSFSKPHELKMYDLSKRLWGSKDNNNAVVVGCSTKREKNPPKAKGKAKAGVLVNGASNGLESAIIGGENGDGEGAEVVKMVAADEKVVTSGAMVSQMDLVGLPITTEAIMAKGLELLTGTKKKEMEENWKKLKVQELEMYLKKIELLKEQGELILDTIKKSGGC